VRKYSGEDYITHLAAVASIVEAVEHTPEMVAAAWLHEMLSKTRKRPSKIFACFFGAAIADHISGFTQHL
jgi:(p)ppGpp synthase/HD superfamily hydrolase